MTAQKTLGNGIAVDDSDLARGVFAHLPYGQSRTSFFDALKRKSRHHSSTAIGPVDKIVAYYGCVNPAGLRHALTAAQPRGRHILDNTTNQFRQQLSATTAKT